MAAQIVPIASYASSYPNIRLFMPVFRNILICTDGASQIGNTLP